MALRKWQDAKVLSVTTWVNVKTLGKPRRSYVFFFLFVVLGVGYPFLSNLSVEIRVVALVALFILLWLWIAWWPHEKRFRIDLGKQSAPCCGEVVLVRGKQLKRKVADEPVSSMHQRVEG